MHGETLGAPQTRDNANVLGTVLSSAAMSLPLRNARCLVTGASRGLGRHIALALANQGSLLHLCARSKEGLEQVAQETRAIGVKTETHAIDVSDRAAVSALCNKLEQDGGIDVLVNNAGIETVGYFHELPAERIEEMLEVNLAASLRLTRALLPGMVGRNHGHVVNIASLAGKTGPPLAETYAVTKAGLIALTQSLRASYAGSGVSSSVICPGYIRGEGMFADRVRGRDDARPPAFIGTSPPEAVGAAVVRAIREDAPELLVTPTPARLFAAVGQLQPRFPGWLVKTLGLRALYEKSRQHS